METSALHNPAVSPTRTSSWLGRVGAAVLTGSARGVWVPPQPPPAARQTGRQTDPGRLKVLSSPQNPISSVAEKEEPGPGPGPPVFRPRSSCSPAPSLSFSLCKMGISLGAPSGTSNEIYAKEELRGACSPAAGPLRHTSLQSPHTGSERPLWLVGTADVAGRVTSEACSWVGKASHPEP